MATVTPASCSCLTRVCPRRIGGLLIYFFWLLLTTMAFWVVRMDQIAELFEGVYQSGRWPVTVYPGWLRISLTFLVPIAFAVTAPAHALTPHLPPHATAPRLRLR